MDAPHLAEVLAVIIEARARGGRSSRVVRDHQFEFQRLLPLTDGHDLADAAEKRIVRDVYREGQAEVGRELRSPGHPALAELQDFLRRTDSHELAHPKGLQTIQAARRLMPEHVGFDIEL